jgi:TPP-dependent pyruvate/acetoin dehydrogenase alpha subunit
MKDFKKITPKKETLEKMMQEMLLIRAFEERVHALFLEGKLHGTTHLAVGQEAVAVGTGSALNKDDLIISTHRGHSHAIAKSGHAAAFMCEIMGKRHGCCLGLGGSMHFCDMNAGVFGSSAIVGGTLPLAVGMGMALQRMGGSRLVVCLFGDGAANQGTVHESMNMAAIWKLPILFLCENNLYGISMRADQAMPVNNVADRAQAYNMPSRVVDGNQVLEVYDAVSDIADRIRRGEGPWLLECKTYRWMGHSKSDQRVYRTQEEENEWKERCPIKAFQSYLLKEHIMSEADLEHMRGAVAEEIETAVRLSEESPVLDIETALSLVYAEGGLDG